MESRDFKDRFSLLIMEPREIYLEDFGATYLGFDQHGTLPVGTVPVKGRFRICTKSVIFDPLDWKYPIVKLLFKTSQKPNEGNERLRKQAKAFDMNENFIVLNNSKCVELLQSNVIGPYKITEKPKIHFFYFHHTHSYPIYELLERLVEISSLPIVDREQGWKDILHCRFEKLKFDMSRLSGVEEKVVLESNCSLVSPLAANPGKLLLSNTQIYFQHLNNIQAEPVSLFKLALVSDIRKRRYLLRHTGIEIFFTSSNLHDLKNNSSSSLIPGQYASSECIGQTDENEGTEDRPVFCFSLFLKFDTQRARDALFDALLGILPQFVKITELSGMALGRMTERWQNGRMSNYDYLMELNNFAGRTFNDLTQYPVFPWVIADYSSQELDLSREETFRDLSKPVGALNNERLLHLKERFREMPEPKFLYGAHYSAPGYVLNYLLRSYPEYMLCLQNGKFDNPNRLFHSLEDTWTSVLNSPTDVKELIPEFYGKKPDFLLNKLSLPLGTRHDGIKVNDVVLPPWADSAEHFLSLSREALESDYVSQHLHEWIDLIFGYKQRGVEAIAADNIFFHLTYEGAVDLERIKDPVERAAIEEQINEFGQIPSQLFYSPHPTRNLCSLGHEAVSGTSSLTHSSLSVNAVEEESDDCEHSLNLLSLYETTQGVSRGCPPLPQSAEDLSAAKLNRQRLSCNAVAFNKCQLTNPCNLSVVREIHICRNEICNMCSSRDSKMLYAVGRDGYLRIVDLNVSEVVRTVAISDLSLSCCCLTANEKHLVIGAWDNSVYFYSVHLGRVLCQWDAHDDAVSSVCVWRHLLFTGSWDGCVKVWNCTQASLTLNASGGPSDCYGNFMFEISDHETEICALCVHPKGDHLLSGSKDGTILLTCVSTESVVEERSFSDASVTSLSFNDDGTIALCSYQDGKVICCTVPDFDTIFTAEIGEPVVESTICGGYVIVCSRHLTVWDITNGDKIFDGNVLPQESSSLEVTQNGCVVVGTTKGTLCVHRGEHL